jgi:[protein-PII] uridylyltransferase
LQPVCDDFFREVESGPPGSSAALNPYVRSYLDAVWSHVLGLHDAGYPGREVNELRTELVDRLVRKLFRMAEDRYFRENPRLDFRFAVVAVGGYGRSELALGSDIDLLFLYRGKLNPYVETLSETIEQRLWDGKLVVGAATRTVPDCLRVGRDDLSTLTSYLDARFLAGDAGLFAEFDREVAALIGRDPRGFVERKLAEQRERHVRKGESLYLLQPDVKEGVGGLRDYHTALWVGRACQWDARRPEHLALHGLLDPDDQAELLEALGFLWRLRNELHRKGRKEDRLHYDTQPRLAEFLGLRDTPELLAVEQLMRQYYLYARTVHRVSQRAVGRAQQLLDDRSGRRERVSYPVAEGFAIADGVLEIPHESLLQERPLRLLSAFAVAQHHDVALSARAQRLIRNSLWRIDDTFRAEPEAASLFRQILDSPLRVYRTLSAMNELGVLAAYLPEFAHLVGLWQQDLYHTYTVDVHSLFLVEQLRRTWKGENRDELPLATQLMREVRRPFPLFLGCILHDVGKGRGGGHSQRGADLVEVVARRLRMSDEEAGLVRFLVLHHLAMSRMADRRDVNDPRTIQQLASLCGSRERLRMLYVLTVADIRSVSAEAWSSWKHSQLLGLYRNTMEWFEAGAGDEAPQLFLGRAMQRAEKTQQEALAQLARAGRDVDDAALLLEVMPRRYLLDHTPQDIALHLGAALDYLASRGDVGVYPFRPGGGPADFWGLVILGHDRPGLLAAAAGALASCGHNILRAQVYTTRDALAMQIYQLSPIAGGEEEEQVERERIEKRLRATLAGEAPRIGRRLRPPVPQGTVRRRAPSVTVANDASDFYTVIDVSANDRPALLYDITRTLSGLGLDIMIAYASTRADRISDSFYVTRDGQKVGDAGARAQIEEALRAAVQDG